MSQYYTKGSNLEGFGYMCHMNLQEKYDITTIKQNTIKYVPSLWDML